MAPGEGDSLGTFQSLSARGRADASEDDSKAGRRDDGRAEKSDGEKQQLSCSVGLQRVYDGEQETSFFASQEVETVGQDDVCGFSEGSQNSFDVLSSNVEGDDSEDDDDDDEGTLSLVPECRCRNPNARDLPCSGVHLLAGSVCLCMQLGVWAKKSATGSARHV